VGTCRRRPSRFPKCEFYGAGYVARDLYRTNRRHGRTAHEADLNETEKGIGHLGICEWLTLAARSR